MGRIAALVMLLACLAGAAPWALSAAKLGARLIADRNDPAALSDLALSDMDAPRLAAALEAALDADDPELAASAVQWADAHHVPLDPMLRARVAEAASGTAQALRAARHFGAGFLTGTPEDLAGFAGAVAGDLTLWGDVRDFSREGWAYARGADADMLLLGLSAAGLALSAGTYATFGASAPVRAGVTLVKGARRTGRLTAAFTADLARLARESVDVGALRRGAGSLDAAVLKGAVRPAGVSRVVRLMDDVGTVQAKAGTRAAIEGLALADDAGDVARLARLSEKAGGQTLFVLKSLGRGALWIGGALLSILWWGALALGWALAAVSALNALAVSAARLCWRRPARARR